MFTDAMLEEISVDRQVLERLVLERLRALCVIEVASDDPRVQADQHRWRQLRRALNRYRGELADLATGFYPTHQRLAHTRVLVGEGWLPPAPVSLED
ncbi:MAG: hypothetical protein M3308_03500, partial [Actinomycetota bacterium]|nr:hypothetical protein [Actinomycetota bacterium]